jgi:hypothetical protein
MTRKIQLLLIAVALLTVFTDFGNALRSKANVEIQFNATWTPDPTLPNGGAIIGRGEGNSGVITVDIPPLTSVPEVPVQLTWESVTSMDITVINENGVQMHFGNRAIKPSAYLIEFTHDWGNDVVVSYELRNNYDGN